MALGNTKSVEALPALTLALQDEEALVRGHVAWAIGRIGTRAGIRALEGRWPVESDAAVRSEIEAAMAEAKQSRSEKPRCSGGYGINCPRIVFRRYASGYHSVMPEDVSRCANSPGILTTVCRARHKHAWSIR